ncbi:Ubiquinone biosynthesis protein coq9, mitochondrial [Ceratocystis pirilliformis]|uniref:Ubiquinone biosynthesis protein n=1 Tax=Ceratocystis pirilliformis TaxID=259994 RepID=A0ABR3ZI52_9PEZI
MSLLMRRQATQIAASNTKCLVRSGILSRTRLYHSYDHPSPPSKQFTPTEKQILGAAYNHVPELGFTTAALTVGAREAGFPEVTAAAVADGAFALVRWHLVNKRQALANQSKALLGEEPLKSSRIVERVEALTWERLKGNGEVIHKWQDALALMAQPSYLPESVKELGALTDEIYFLAGDVSVDPSWYTKRGSLSMIYASSELFMTNDRSQDFADTQEFLSRRLRETSALGNVMGAIGQWTGFTASAALNVLRSKGIRV